MTFKGNGWAIVPGPNTADDGTVFSYAVSELADVSPGTIASAVLALEGASAASTESWWDWRAVVEQRGERLELAMTLMGEDEELWGGFDVVDVSSAVILADVVDALSSAVEGIWLHSDEGVIHDPVTEAG